MGRRGALFRRGVTLIWPFGVCVMLVGCGDNTPTSNPPVDDAAPKLVSVSAGGAFTCGLDEDGRAYCWGSGHYGSLGDGTTGSLGDGTIPFRTTPIAVVGDLRFRWLRAGTHHACGVTVTGASYCWGFNHWMQLGAESGDLCLMNNTPCSKTPVQVTGEQSFREVHAGLAHSCGLTALGQAHCWGANYAGQLGRGTIEPNANSDPGDGSPQPVLGDHVFTALSAGRDYTCGLTVDGTAFCWGSHRVGELGAGDSPTSTCRILGTDAPCSPIPVEVAGGHRFDWIDAGYMHACGIATDGSVFCWGRDAFGIPLGATPPPLERCVPNERCSRVPLPAAGGTSLTSLAIGFDHSCGLTSTGEVYCWGIDYAGGSSVTPLRVGDLLTFVSLTALYQHTCGMAMDGEAYCWGMNEYGQLGDGTTATRNAPTPVSRLPE